MLRVGAARRMPDVAQLARSPNRPRRAPPDPELGLRRGVRLGRRIVKRPELALEGLFTTPERAHQPDGLVGAAAPSFKGNAHEPELVSVPAHADAEAEAAAAQLL